MSKTTLQKLKEFGIRCGKLKDLELEDRFFLELDENRRKLLIWEPKTPQEYSVKITGSKKLQQAVITVEEKQFSKDFCTVTRQYDADNLQYYKREDVFVADNQSLFFVLCEEERLFHPEMSIRVNSVNLDTCLVSWTANIPSSKLSFLVGKDESHYFISALPEPCNSVKAAHEILIPKELKGEKFLRQGEFFFKKVSPPKNLGQNYGLWNNMEILDSDHYADFTYIHKDKMYCMGNVTHERHAPLFLDGIYEVFKNTEVESLGERWD